MCGKSFNSRDNRNMHRFVHSDKKPYECLACGAGYMRKQLLYQHMNITVSSTDQWQPVHRHRDTMVCRADELRKFDRKHRYCHSSSFQPIVHRS